MSVTLGDTTLDYTVIPGKNYMVSHLHGSDVTSALGIIDGIFDTLIPLYESAVSAAFVKSDKSTGLTYGNRCGPNSAIISKVLTEQGMKSPILLIRSWTEPKNKDIIRTIESTYGGTTSSISCAYHSLGYTEVTTIEDRTFYIAIETNIPGSMQFYVGSTMEELALIIKARYQCIEFIIRPDSEKAWHDRSDHDKTYGGKRKNKRRKTKRRGKQRRYKKSSKKCK
jgi:hypothetical protein